MAYTGIMDRNDFVRQTRNSKIIADMKYYPHTYGLDEDGQYKPIPINDDSKTVANTEYVKDNVEMVTQNINAVDMSAVHKTMDETISGNKTFLGNTSFSGNSSFSSNTSFSSITTGVTVDTNDNSTKFATTAYVNNKLQNNFKVVYSLPANPDANTFYFVIG